VKQVRCLNAVHQKRGMQRSLTTSGEDPCCSMQSVGRRSIVQRCPFVTFPILQSGSARWRRSFLSWANVVGLHMSLDAIEEFTIGGEVKRGN
jgi:hypothetical protein